MIVQSTEELNPISPRDILEAMIGRSISDIALGLIQANLDLRDLR